MPVESFQSIPEMFLHRVRSTPDSVAFQFPRNGGWDELTWKEVGIQVQSVAMGLAGLGLGSEDRCAILSGTIGCHSQLLGNRRRP